jgi:broad specificity phosphatase PhoE
MSQKLYFLRHAETKFDENCPPRDWVLSETGENQSQMIAHHHNFRDIDVIICSTEKKTTLTALPLSEKLQVSIQYNGGLDEINSNNLPLTDHNIYLQQKKYEFRHLNEASIKKESYENGLNRFNNAINFIQQTHRNKKILIVSHGTVLTLYFAQIIGILSNGNHLCKRWRELEFCAWGLIEGGKLIRDIKK